MISCSLGVKSISVKRLSHIERRTHQCRLPPGLFGFFLDTTVAKHLVCSSGCRGYISSSFES